MKVRLKLKRGQLNYYNRKGQEARATYLYLLEVDHLARGRQEFAEARELDPDTTSDFESWFRAWNKIHIHPLKPKKARHRNTHLESSTLWGD
jgi:hypothetical protein